jgi:hypothetical protein
MRENMTNFCVFSPDENASNKLDNIYEVSKKLWLAPENFPVTVRLQSMPLISGKRSHVRCSEVTAVYMKKALRFADDAEGAGRRFGRALVPWRRALSFTAFCQFFAEDHLSRRRH